MRDSAGILASTRGSSACAAIAASLRAAITHTITKNAASANQTVGIRIMNTIRVARARSG